jgi:hypothetical protein
MKKMLVALLGLVMVAGAAFAHTNQGNAFSNPQASVLVDNAPVAYAYFIDGTHGLPSSIGDPIVFLPGSGMDATTLAAAAQAAAAGTDFVGYRLDIVGDLVNHKGAAKDTAIVACGSNVAGSQISFSLNIPPVANARGEASLADMGEWSFLWDGLTVANPIKADGTAVTMGLCVRAVDQNVDIITPLTLNVDKVGIEAAQGAWNGTFTLTVVPGAGIAVP